MPKRMFYVQVERHFEVESVDLEIEAETQDEAEDKALAEARRDEAMLFGPRMAHTPSFEVVEIIDGEGEE